jgi:hypothetical protein
MASDMHRDEWMPPLRGLIPASVTVQAMARDLIDGVQDTWDDIEVSRDPAECLPGLTLCSDTECLESWLNDFYLRVLTRGVVTWTSPDAPTAAGTVQRAERSAVVIPFPRR